MDDAAIKMRSMPWHSQDCLLMSLRGEVHLAVEVPLMVV